MLLRAAALLMPLTACATVSPTAEPARRSTGSGGVCDAEAAQYHLGHQATQAMGAAILSDSGAAALRWGPPESVWTMDFRHDRVNVRYDTNMKITAITCG